MDIFTYKKREIPQKNETNLDNLIIDCQLIILESLDFLSLLSISQVNRQLWMLAVFVFEKKFSKHTIEIKDGPSWNPTTNSEEDVNHFVLNIIDIISYLDPFGTEEEIDRPPSVSMFDKLIQIHDYTLTLFILKYFGSVIKKLKVDYNFMNLDQSNIINGMINEYCVETLVEIQLNYCDENVMKSFTTPFENVKIVIFGMELGSIGNESLPLDRLFPNIKLLSVAISLALDETFFDFYLPTLERLYFRAEHQSRDAIESKVEHLIKKNQQNEVLNVSPKFLQITNQMLPDLESLYLVSFAMDGDSIHFENVKTFFMKNGLYSSPVNISFSVLEELQMSYYDNRFNAWSEFFTKHSNLSRLQIEESIASDIHEQFDALTEELKNINEISIVCNGPIGIQSIARFLGGQRKKLEKMSLITIPDDDKEILRQRFEAQWNIEIYKTLKIHSSVVYRFKEEIKQYSYQYLHKLVN